MGRKRMHNVVLPAGIHRVKFKNGKTAYYWRPGRGTIRAQTLKRQWRRLPDDPSSEQFLRELNHCHGMSNAPAAPAALPAERGLAALIGEYRSSPRFARLKPASKRLYEIYLRELDRQVGTVDPRDIEPRHIATMRDKLAKKPGKADMCVTVMRNVFAFARERGIVAVNPADGIKKISVVKPHKQWPQWCVDLIDEMGPELRVACYLGLYTAQRKIDVLKMTLRDIKGNAIDVVAEKTGKRHLIPVHQNLLPVIQGCKARGHVYLVSRKDGRPYEERSFQSLWKSDPAARKVAQGGYVFHGLRKLAVSKLFESGASTRQVSAITGHNLKLLEHYSMEAENEILARAGMEKWENI